MSSVRMYAMNVTKQVVRRHWLSLVAVLGLVCAGFIVVGNIFMVVVHDARDRVIDATVQSVPMTLGTIAGHEALTSESLEDVLIRVGAETPGLVDAHIVRMTDLGPVVTASLHRDEVVYTESGASVAARALPHSVTTVVRGDGYTEASYAFTNATGTVAGYVDTLFKRDLFAAPVERNLVRALVVLLGILGLTFFLLAWFIGTREHKRLLRRTVAQAQLHDELMTKVMHEVQTPLTVLNGYLAMLREMDINKTVQGYVTKMKAAVDQLHRFVTNAELSMLLEQRAIPVRLETSNPVQIVHDAVDTIQKKYAYLAPAITFSTRASANVYTDATRLRFAIEQVLLNAIQHGGTKVDVDLRVEGGDVCIHIKDYGKGMPATVVAVATEKWERATTNTELLKGSGLGLWLVREMLKQAKGSVTITSKPSEGTEVVIRVQRVL